MPPSTVQARPTPRSLIILLLAACLCLSACSASDLLEPIGIGPDRDQLKRSPCACFEIMQNYRGWAVS